MARIRTPLRLNFGQIIFAMAIGVLSGTYIFRPALQQQLINEQAEKELNQSHNDRKESQHQQPPSTSNDASQVKQETS